MGVLNQGVSGGLPVTNQAGGINLTVAGDYGLLPISNASPPAGPDAQGQITLSSPSATAVVALQQIYPGANPAVAANWTPLTGATLAGGVTIGPSVVVPPNTPLTVFLGNITNLAAIRVYLTASLGSAVANVQGVTAPGETPGLEAAILQAVQANTQATIANVLASCDAASQDYFALAQGFTYP